MLKDKYTYLKLKDNKQYEMYYDFLVGENTKYNLTTIVKKEEVYIKHFLDSVKLLEFVDIKSNSIIYDVGSGAGFPLIPLLIERNDIKGVGIESNNKKCEFLKLLSNKLGLNNVIIKSDRVENLINDENATYVCARAVAKLNILLELLVGILKIGGRMFLYKGANYKEELALAKNAIKLLGLAHIDTFEYELENDFGKRVILVFEKRINSSYPRKYTQIKTKPL